MIVGLDMFRKLIFNNVFVSDKTYDSDISI